jgi:hypothetical protein
MVKFLIVATLLGLAAIPAAAEPGAPCPGHPEALGTSRVLAVDPATTPRVGRKHFPATCPSLTRRKAHRDMLLIRRFEEKAGQMHLR